VWVTVSVAEARELLQSLVVWDEEVEAGRLDPEWHMHISDSDGTELTIAVEPDAESG
jgi:hypothetical protein